MTSKLARRTLIAGSVGLVGVGALQWRDVAVGIGNVARRGEHAIAGGTPYLDAVRVLPAPGPGPVSVVAWSNDGSRLAAISDFGRAVTVWRADGTRLAEIARTGLFADQAIAFLSNDLVLTPASHPTAEQERFALTLWNVRTGLIERNVDGPDPDKGYSWNQAEYFSISPDARVVASAPIAGGLPVTLYSTDDWSRIATLPINSADDKGNSVCSVAFSPDGKVLAVGLISSVRQFSVGDANVLEDKIDVYSYGALRNITGLAFSADGRFLATGSSRCPNGLNEIAGCALVTVQRQVDFPLKIFHLADRTVTAAYPHFAVRQLSWSVGGRFLAASIVNDGSVRVFSPLSGEEVARSPRYSGGRSVSCSPRDALLAAATDNSVTIFALPDS